MFASYQEAFDKTVEFLAKQKVASIMDDSCAYSDGYGNHCAVGFHIPDDHPAAKCTFGVDALINQHPDVEQYLSIVDGVDIEFWARMQEAHDHSFNVDSIKQRLNTIADQYKLNKDKIDLIKKWSNPFFK